MIFIFGGELCASSKNVFITRRDGGMLAIEFLSSRKKITIAFIVVCCWFRARRCFSFRLHCICSIRSFKGGKECYLIAGENNENFYVSRLQFYFLEAFIGIVILEILVIKLSDGFLSTIEGCTNHSSTHWNLKFPHRRQRKLSISSKIQQNVHDAFERRDKNVFMLFRVHSAEANYDWA